MFKEPGESSPKKAAEKTDCAVNSSRSAIRRERTIRDSEVRRRFGGRGDFRARRVGRPSTDLPPRSVARRSTRVGQDDAPEQARDGPYFGEPRRWSTMTDTARYGDEETIENRRRRQAGEELLHDALQYQRPSHRMRVPRSPRTSALRFEVSPAPRSSAFADPSMEEQAFLARPYMPSPPYSFSDGSVRSRVVREADGPLEGLRAEPTPGFAPARAPARAAQQHNGQGESNMRDNLPRQNTPPGESSWTASYPPLRRVGHLSLREDSDLSRYEGLGDRRRSPSTSSSEVEHDGWETLLTTMEPDNHLPSADSSFTSATASHSTRQSRQSSQTPTTSFASTVPLTERALSRPASPSRSGLVSNRVGEMDLAIQSPQYDCLSPESRSSMRAMLQVIQNSQTFRAGNPIEDVSERRRRADENLILSNHFNTLKMIDDLRAARRRLMPASEQGAPYGLPSQIGLLDSRHGAALDLFRTMGHQTQQMARVGDDAQNSAGNPERSLADTAEEGARPQSSSGRVQQEWEHHRHYHQPQNQDTTDTNNDLDNMQRFIERMARRQDIPDEWWAAAGLARTIRENQ